MAVLPLCFSRRVVAMLTEAICYLVDKSWNKNVIFLSGLLSRFRQQLESVLSKSKSQSTFGDEIGSASRKGSSIRRSQTQSAMPRAIEEIQAKLQQTGESGWRRRLQQNNNSNDELKLLNMNRYNVSICFGRRLP